jgi:plasmid stabilization system protein ParE
MARLVYSPASLADVDRLSEFLLDLSPQLALETGRLVAGAIAILKDHPLMGRIVEGGLRELVISRGRTGYLALYRYDAEWDEVIILAVRHQRELRLQWSDVQR